MLDRRINKLKEILLRQADEAPVVRHLVDANPRGDDMLGEVCRAAVLLHPSASFEQALTLARTMAYIVYIDDYLEEDHAELDLGDYRRVCQTFLLWHNRDLSQMPLLHATIGRKIEDQFREDEVPDEWTAMRRLVWEKSIWTMLQENHWLKHKERVTLDAYLANGMYSSSFPIVQVSILAFSYQDVSQELKNRIFGHICQASRVVRLANDLRTHERESAQGRFNSVDLISGGSAERISPYLDHVDCPVCLRWVQEWRRPTWWTEADRAFVNRRPDHAHDRGLDRRAGATARAGPIGR